MARRPKNGQGESFSLSVTFDPSLNEDVRAYAVWQYLSDQRKGTAVIKAVLHMIADHEERTGVVLTPERIMALFLNGQVMGYQQGPPLKEPIQAEDVDIVAHVAGQTATSEEIAQRFLDSTASQDIFGD